MTVQKVLADQCAMADVVAAAAALMPDATFTRAFDVSAHQLSNGALHDFAVAEGFDRLLTADGQMPFQTVPRVPTVVFLWHMDLTDGDLRDMGEDCVPLLARADVGYHPVYPREGSANYHARLGRANRIEEHGLRPRPQRRAYSPER